MNKNSEIKWKELQHLEKSGHTPLGRDIRVESRSLAASAIAQSKRIIRRKMNTTNGDGN
jgi:hypothetical protein